MSAKENARKTGLGLKMMAAYDALGYRSHNDFAKALRVTNSAVGQWFIGKTEPSERAVIALIKAHKNVNILWLLFDEEPILIDSYYSGVTDESLIQENDTLKRENKRLRDHIDTLSHTIEIIRDNIK